MEAFAQLSFFSSQKIMVCVNLTQKLAIMVCMDMSERNPLFYI